MNYHKRHFNIPTRHPLKLDLIILDNENLFLPFDKRLNLNEMNTLEDYEDTDGELRKKMNRKV